MPAIMLSALVMAAHLLLTIAIPGIFFAALVSRRRQTPLDATTLLMHIFGFGSLYATAQFFLTWLLIRAGTVPLGWCVLGKYTLDVVVFALLLVWQGRFLRDGIRVAAAAVPANRTNLTLFLLAIAFGLLAIWRRPFALDNSALVWAAGVLEGQLLSLSISKGAPAYVALVLFPGYLLHDIAPAPTLATTLKLPLSLLMAFTVHRFVRLLPVRLPGFSPLVFFIIMCGSHLGSYGIMENGKESAFAMLFFMLYAVELWRAAPTSAWEWRAGLPLAAAFGFGAITIPYAGILTALFVVFALDRVRPFSLSLRLLTLTVLPLLISFHAMTEVSLWHIAAAGAGLWLLFALLHRVSLAGHFVGKRLVWSPRIVAGVLVVCLIGLAWIMPIRFEACPRPPLDGQKTLAQLLLFRGLRTPLHLLGFAGLVAIWFSPRLTRNPGIQAFVLFPFVTLFLVCSLASIPDLPLPFHPQHFWDLAKDIPAWCFGFYFGLLALIAVRGIRQLRERPDIATLLGLGRPGWLAGREWLVVVLFFVLIVGFPLGRTIHLLTRSIHYTRVGGHHDRAFATVVEHCTYRIQVTPESRQLLNETQRIYVATDSKLNRRAAHLCFYGLPAQRLDLNTPRQQQELLRHLPARFVGKRAALQHVARQAPTPIQVEEIQPLNETEALFFISAQSESNSQ